MENQGPKKKHVFFGPWFFMFFFVSLFLTFGPKWVRKSIIRKVTFSILFRYFSQRSFWGGSGIDFGWILEDFGSIWGAFWEHFGNMLMHFGCICDDFACLWNSCIRIRFLCRSLEKYLSSSWKSCWFICLFVCMFFCLLCLAVLGLACLAWGVSYLCWRCLSCLALFSVACFFCLVLFSVAWLCWRCLSCSALLGIVSLCFTLLALLGVGD